MHKSNPTFAMIGAAGYVAERHLQAMAAVGGSLVAALDKSDSVGVLDRYFPGAAFFTEFERFDRHLEKLRHGGTPVDYVVVCSPNYLHDPHIRFGLRYGADVICEKPLVLNPENAVHLQELEQQCGRRVWAILQLRLHPMVEELRRAVAEAKATGLRPKLALTYITARGDWYYASWKGAEDKSGGVMTNIGIHLFDLLIWLFGPVQKKEMHVSSHDRAGGMLQFMEVDVSWFLSINADTLPQSTVDEGRRAVRKFAVGEKTIELTEGFEDLHSLSYQKIQENQGFTISDALPALDLVWRLRSLILTPIHMCDTAHELSKLPLSVHPFKKK
jgi:UDP-N-acetyl-2-amino-2-deoxyglucuronate dehydrogenase